MSSPRFRQQPQEQIPADRARHIALRHPSTHVNTRQRRLVGNGPDCKSGPPKADTTYEGLLLKSGHYVGRLRARWMVGLGCEE